MLLAFGSGLYRLTASIRRGETRARIAKHRAVIDAEGFDPTLLSKSEPDEKTQLDQFRGREVLVQSFPQSIVGDIGVPGDGAGIGQRNFFPLGKSV